MYYLSWAFQRTHYWTHKIQDGGDPPSWILTPKCKNAIFSKTKQVRATVSIEHLYSPRMVEEIKEEKKWNNKQTNSDMA